MNEAGPWIALSALIVALSTLVFGLFQYRLVARKDYVGQLEGDIDRLDQRAEKCEAEGKDLRRHVEECEKGRSELLREQTRLLVDLRHLERQARDGT